MYMIFDNFLANFPSFLALTKYNKFDCFIDGTKLIVNGHIIVATISPLSLGQDKTGNAANGLFLDPWLYDHGTLICPGDLGHGVSIKLDLKYLSCSCLYCHNICVDLLCELGWCCNTISVS